MAQKSWDEQVFTVSGQLKDLAGNLELLTGTTTGDSSSVVNEAIALVKADMKEILTGILPQIFERSQVYSGTLDTWLNSYGKSWEQLDDFLNRLHNPTCLNKWSDCAVLVRLFNRRLSMASSGYGGDINALTDLRDYWQGQLDQWQAVGIKNLKIDFNLDGTVQIDERVRKRVTLSRG
jgi:hypothetical protein